jgi:hypothetical protein
MGREAGEGERCYRKRRDDKVRRKRKGDKDEKDIEGGGRSIVRKGAREGRRV